jgi:predicted acylesterase/phospholipase RssA
MDDPALTKALVLQGGGALGAYELGVARVLLGEHNYRPDLVAGVSIGAITAVLLARPKGGDPLAALEAFWKQVAVPAPLLPDKLKPYAANFGNPAFFMPRLDVWNALAWTSFYSTEPLRRTLAGLVDETALADPTAMPRLLVTATDVKAGEITPFWSGDAGLTLDHILASGSLPPSFPATDVAEIAYWDGGVFDNTPLGEVIGHMKPGAAPDGDREIVLVNLFPNAGEMPADIAGVVQRMMALTFANKTASDIKLLCRFNAVAALMREIRADAAFAPLRETEAFKTLDRNYIEIPRILAVTRSGDLEGPVGSDFSPGGIERLAAAGEQAARQALAEGATDPCIAATAVKA